MRGRINGTLVLGAVLALLSAPVAADAATPDELAGQVRAAAVSEGWKRFFAGAYSTNTTERPSRTSCPSMRADSNT